GARPTVIATGSASSHETLSKSRSHTAKRPSLRNDRRGHASDLVRRRLTSRSSRRAYRPVLTCHRGARLSVNRCDRPRTGEPCPHRLTGVAPLTKYTSDRFLDGDPHLDL